MYRKQYEEFCILILGCKGLRGKPVGCFQTAKELYLGLRRKKIDLVVSAVSVIKWVKTSWTPCQITTFYYRLKIKKVLFLEMFLSFIQLLGDPCFLVSFVKVLYESTSEESAGEGEEESNSGLVDLEDLGPMMDKMKKDKVKIF